MGDTIRPQQEVTENFSATAAAVLSEQRAALKGFDLLLAGLGGSFIQYC